MTREEAIKGLKVLAKDFSGYRPNEEMFNMAIKALEQPEQDCMLKQFGNCLYAEIGCSDCAIKAKIREALSSTQQKPLKYTGDSICLYCQTINCDGCMYEPMEGMQ